MILLDTEHRITLNIINTSESENNDIKTFVDFIKICHTEATKPGFNNLFNENQRKIITEIHSIVAET